MFPPYLHKAEYSTTDPSPSKLPNPYRVSYSSTIPIAGNMTEPQIVLESNHALENKLETPVRTATQPETSSQSTSPPSPSDNSNVTRTVGDERIECDFMIWESRLTPNTSFLLALLIEMLVKRNGIVARWSWTPYCRREYAETS